MLRGGGVIGARPCAVSGETMRGIARDVAAVRGLAPLRAKFRGGAATGGRHSGDAPAMS
ncbi:hypothetical protein F511_47607 [Dorcoceras hygrometricum]|uniref:Uncharacterized protein n=1 Tax=Dorcoceras hygrometricum TaxID=472368 RepID=A0A2Z6ZWU8_9LAMI|nr:hypothetical protein F511_47607 [Dorcoceras hygrometricum]